MSQITSNDQSLMSREELKKKFTKMVTNMNSRALEREIPIYKEAFPQLVESDCRQRNKTS